MSNDPRMVDETDRYRTDRYLEEHPLAHEEDSLWKSQVLQPLLDEFVDQTNERHVAIMDVGGGAGTVLRLCTEHLSATHGLDIQKILLELSPGLLSRQVSTHGPNAWPILGDVRRLPFSAKSIDLVMLVDVLEHVPEPHLALEEIARAAHFAILKVPLERNLYFWAKDRYKRGRFKSMLRNRYGHINDYTYTSLRRQISRHLGHIIAMRTANVFAYFGGPNQPGDWTRVDKAMNSVVGSIHSISPRTAARLSLDFALVLVACR